MFERDNSTVTDVIWNLFPSCLLQVQEKPRTITVPVSYTHLIDLYLTVCPNSSAGVFWVKNHKLLSETVSNNNTTIRTEVVHAGTASNTHMSVAKMKMEISLCSITVNPSIPKVSMGRNHKIRERVIAMVNFIPVSYTHLDVYKRQPYALLIKGQLQPHRIYLIIIVIEFIFNVKKVCDGATEI